MNALQNYLSTTKLLIDQLDKTNPRAKAYIFPLYRNKRQKRLSEQRSFNACKLLSNMSKTKPTVSKSQSIIKASAEHIYAQHPTDAYIHRRSFIDRVFFLICRRGPVSYSYLLIFFLSPSSESRASPCLSRAPDLHFCMYPWTVRCAGNKNSARSRARAR